MTLLPARRDLVIVQGSDQAIPFRLIDGDGNVLDTTSWLARATIRVSPDDAQVFHMSTGNGRLETGYDPPPWDNSTAYVLGEYVVPTTLNGHIYVVTVAGTSHATTEPTWPLTDAGTVVNGTVTFTEAGSDEVVTNLRLSLANADTTALADWGCGFWDAEVIDTFGKVLRILEGDAILSREITQ